MKKLLILALAFCAIVGIGRAATNTMHTLSVTGYTLASNATTEVTGNISGSGGAQVWAVQVKNLDTTNDVCCSPSSSVACNLASTTNIGDPVVHRSSGTQPNAQVWWVGPNQKLYCISSGGTPIIVVDIAQ